MDKNFSIKISDFTGIFRVIADKSNKNGNDALEGYEICIFNDARKTLRNDDSIFTFEGRDYDKDGNVFMIPEILTAKKDATQLPYDYRTQHKDDKTLQESIKEFEAEKVNSAAIDSVKEYDKKFGEIIRQREETIKKIAGSWAKTYKINNKDGSFDEFVRRLYDIAVELNIIKTFKPYDPQKYPTKEDQIVDEMCSVFALESSFDNKSVAETERDTYYGIFQFTQVALTDMVQNDLINKNNLKKIQDNNISNFTKLNRLEQLEYALVYVKHSKKNRSMIGNSPISSSQMAAIIGNPYALKQPLDDNRKYILSEREKLMSRKMRVRDKATTQ